jgi:hypothetical protein
MKKLFALIGLVAGLWSGTTLAVDQPKNYVSGDFFFSSDSDHFSASVVSAGGGRYVNDTDRYGAKIRHYNYSDPSFSDSGTGVVVEVKKLVEASGLALKLSGELGVAGVAGNNNVIGKMLVETDFKETHIEGEIERSVVDSAKSLTKGITSTSVYLNADRQLTDTIDASVGLGITSFSDDNRRDEVKLKVSYLLSDDYGIVLYTKGRYYTNSQPNTGNYFGPEKLYSGVVGVSVKHRFDYGMIAVLAVDHGTETITNYGETTSRPITSATLRLDSVGKPTDIQYSAVLGYSTAAGISSDPNYSYTYLMGYITAPLQ